jgi:hypothetical protein
MSDTTGATTPEHGIPDPATDAEPTGLPTSDRHHSETAPHKDGGDKDVPKHKHAP